jgi:hypothetical protein
MTFVVLRVYVQGFLQAIVNVVGRIKADSKEEAAQKLKLIKFDDKQLQFLYFSSDQKNQKGKILKQLSTAVAFRAFKIVEAKELAKPLTSWD